MTLYPHQQKILSDDPKKCGLFLATGGGKTLTALHLAQGRVLVVCPKTLRDDGTWGNNYLKMESDNIKELKVISKEEFRRDHATLPRYDTVIFDEAHTITGVLPNIRYRNKKPIPKASQLFEAAQAYLARTKPERLYLLTATPIRSPMAVWGLATLLGKSWDFYKFRDAFYVRLNMPGREVWSPRTDRATKERLAGLLQKLGYVWKLSDGFDVPQQVERAITCELSTEQKKLIKELPLEFPNPLVLSGKMHQAEQGESKAEAIYDLYLEFGKVLVFAKYTDQLRHLEGYFSAKKIPTWTLDGHTRNRKAFMEIAEKAKEGIALVQASVSAGYELPSFSCVVFASLSWSCVDYIQAQGRVLRVNALKSNLYAHLVSGKVDRLVLNCVQNKKDFNERIFEKEIMENKL